MKLFFAILFLLLFGCMGSTIQDRKKDNQESKGLKALESKNSIRHKSFKQFIDSLTYAKGVVYSNKLIKSTSDTFNLGRSNYKILNVIGDIKQYYHYFGLQTNRPFSNSADSCYSFLQFGSHKWDENFLQCQLNFECPEKSEFTFNQNKFIYRVGSHMSNCIGSACRVNYYPLFAIHKRDTSFHLFVNPDDIIGLRYGDFNKDKSLDFLVVKSSFSMEDLKRLTTKGEQFKNWNCPDLQCYKITVITFRGGKWEMLKDSMGKEYYFLILLDEPLNPDVGFKLLDFHWMD